jgi:hypothetical protein
MSSSGKMPPRNKKKKRNLARSPSQNFLQGDPGEVSVKETSMLNEKRLSEKLGFRLTPGSGCAGWLRKKGDGRTDDYVVECKETKARSIRITEEMLKKVYAEAKLSGKEPVMVISIYGMDEPTPADWVMVPAYLLESD